LQVLVRDNNVDQALRVLKKKMQREGVFREMKRRRFYEKPSEKMAREKSEAIRRVRKLARKRAQREGLIAAPRKKAVSTEKMVGQHQSRTHRWWRSPRGVKMAARAWLKTTTNRATDLEEPTLARSDELRLANSAFIFSSSVAPAKSDNGWRGGELPKWAPIDGDQVLKII
jgi:small subunit ribosomal protein S21